MALNPPPAPSTRAEDRCAGYRSVLDAVRLPMAPGVSPNAAADELTVQLEALIARNDDLPPVTEQEADRLAAALKNFQRQVEALQERSDPPPPLPRLVDGSSIDWIDAWYDWLVPYRFMDSKRPGHPVNYNWPVIAQLLALYEISFDREASSSKPRHFGAPAHPTIRFLEAAFERANLIAFWRTGVDPKLRSPPAETLRHQLNALRGERFEQFKSRFRDKLIGEQTQKES